MKINSNFNDYRITIKEFKYKLCRKCKKVISFAKHCLKCKKVISFAKHCFIVLNITSSTTSWQQPLL